MNNSDTKREMLRHTVATLAYRGASSLHLHQNMLATGRGSDSRPGPWHLAKCTGPRWR